MNIILAPFKALLALVFESSLNLSGNPGLSIIILSLTVTLCLLPVQKLIDIIKARNAGVKSRMKPVEDEIERCYTGQTKYLYLKTLYRQNGYNPINNFISLAVPLIQIPFFLAAYSYLSAQKVFTGQSFFAISDLSRPDGLISFSTIAINLFPLVMTLANLINIELVTGEKQSEKTMLRYLALFFLLALYAMPSALVLYWMMNNVFLLVINILKNKNPKIYSEVISNWKTAALKILNIRHHLPELTFSLVILAGYTYGLHKLNPTPDSIGAQLMFKASILFGLLAVPVGLISLKSFTIPTFSKISLKQVGVLFMFCTFPVVHYAYENIAFLNTRFLLELLGYLILPALILLSILKLSFNRVFKTDYYLVFVSAVILSFFLTPVGLSVFKVRIEEGFWFQIGLLVVVLALVMKLFFHHYKTFVIISFCVFFVSFGRFSSRLIKRMNSHTNIESQVNIPTYFPKSLKRTPDIYLLVYDAYIDEKFSDHLGIENKTQFTYLKEKGFTVYHDKYSIDRTSLKSMAPVFSMGETKLSDRKTLVGHSRLDRFLKSQGYETYYVAKDYFFREEKENASGIIITPNEARNTLLDGILQGEFKFETISRGYDYSKWKQIKNDLFSRQELKPRLIYTHSPYPGHAQFSGTCLANERELYKERLIKANEEMKRDIENILTHHPEAIIITAGDHGSYLTGDCYSMSGTTAQQITGEHLADRFGVHLAIRWPDQQSKEFDDIKNLQGVFFAVLGYLGESKEILGHQPDAKVCLRGVCASNLVPLTEGPDKGKMLFSSF